MELRPDDMEVAVSAAVAAAAAPQPPLTASATTTGPENAAADAAAAAASGADADADMQGDGDSDGDGALAPSAPLRPPPPPCEQCGAAPARYRCPRCQLRTCSLACVRAHKEGPGGGEGAGGGGGEGGGGGCSGQRDRAAFLPMKEFDDRALLSDYRLLEEVARAEDVARRCRPPGAKPQLPPHLASLVYQAQWRSVRLLIMPPGGEGARPGGGRGAGGGGGEGEEVLMAHLVHPAPHYIPLRPYAKAGLEGLRVFMRKEKTPVGAGLGGGGAGGIFQAEAKVATT
ncbi:Box C/D snoRNA protein 1 [Tetrabaena socialis]|uniref:Box C/D snoRNA protein 1 n=1 Tax=Tetrabaena socialis TaxID=47790 RepID=A0A2J7ZUX0_9CHLO|nr:Box C/D snoRNA protein 1 [Tetrabaena socialis]|eukprot:PNH04040.1 Box C/D snoRNA protein 1 [Tetrabaena socialis]